MEHPQPPENIEDEGVDLEWVEACFGQIVHDRCQAVLDNGPNPLPLHQLAGTIEKQVWAENQDKIGALDNVMLGTPGCDDC